MNTKILDEYSKHIKQQELIQVLSRVETKITTQSSTITVALKNKYEQNIDHNHILTKEDYAEIINFVIDKLQVRQEQLLNDAKKAFTEELLNKL